MNFDVIYHPFIYDMMTWSFLCFMMIWGVFCGVFDVYMICFLGCLIFSWSSSVFWASNAVNYIDVTGGQSKFRRFYDAFEGFWNCWYDFALFSVPKKSFFFIFINFFFALFFVPFFYIFFKKKLHYFQYQICVFRSMSIPTGLVFDVYHWKAFHGPHRISWSFCCDWYLVDITFESWIEWYGFEKLEKWWI